MKRLSAVIFDYGQVLSRPQRDADVDAMAREAGVRREMFDDLYWEFRARYDKGMLSDEEYWGLIAGPKAKSATKLARLVELDSLSWAHPSKRVLQWATALRGHGTKTAVLSNMPRALKEYLLREMPWMPEFDHSTYSCDVGMMKPERGIYQHCVSGLGVAPEDAVFLDDRGENIIAAREFGLNAVHFTSREQAAAELADQFELPVPLA